MTRDTRINVTISGRVYPVTAGSCLAEIGEHYPAQPITPALCRRYGMSEPDAWAFCEWRQAARP
jgi:hypothetical protein